MNSAITVVRHETIDDIPYGNLPGVLHMNNLGGAVTDEEAIAHVLCARNHDDKITSDAAKRCHTIHLFPPGCAPEGTRVMDPDPQCVIKRTAFLQRWNGVNTSRSDAPSRDSAGSAGG